MKLRIFNGFRTPVEGGEKTCKVGSKLERKHHFDCSIFQKNIRFIAKGFIVFCPIFLSNDAEKNHEAARSNHKKTSHIHSNRRKNRTGTRVKRVPAKGGIDVRHDRSIANHQPRLASRNQS